jgi:hypothetical protein
MKSTNNPKRHDNKDFYNWVVPLVTLLAILILTISFIQGEREYLKWGELVDDGKIANYFTSLEAIFVATTLFYIGRQLSEARITRLKSYEPVLLPIQTKLLWREVNVAAFDWTNSVNEEIHFTIDKVLIGSPELRNIGNGIATNVNIAWEYDSNLVLEKILYLYDEGRTLWNSEGVKQSEQNVVLIEEQIVVSVPYYYLLMWSDEGV